VDADDVSLVRVVRDDGNHLVQESPLGEVVGDGHEPARGLRMLERGGMQEVIRMIDEGDAVHRISMGAFSL
jgi:hypothetical protein